MKFNKEENKSSKRSCRYGLWPLLIAIIVLSFAGSLQYYFYRERAEAMDHLNQSMHTVINRITSSNELISLYTEFDDQDSRYYMNTAIHLIEELGFSEETFAWFNEGTTDGYYVYIDADGKQYGPAERDIPAFSAEQIETLVSGKSLEIDGYVVIGGKCGDGLVVTGWEQNIPETLFEDALFEDRDTGLYIQNTKTGTISRKYDGEKLFERAVPVTIPMEKLLPANAKDMEAGYAYPKGAEGLSRRTKGCYYLAYDLGDGRRIVLYSTVREILGSSIMDAFVCYLIMLLFAIVTYRSAKLLKKSIRKYKTEEFHRLSKKYSIHKPTASRLISLLLFSVLIIMAVTTYTQVVADYAYYCNTATKDLERVTANIEEDKRISETIRADFVSKMEIRGRDLADLFNAMPQFLEGDALQTLAAIWETDEITVFDSNGKIVATTGNYAGYTLSTLPEDPEYCCWELLNGEATSKIYPLDDGSDRYVVAVRRIDKKGFIRFNVSAQQLNRIVDSLTVTRSVLTTGVSANIAYIELSDPTTVHWIDATAAKEKTYKTTNDVTTLPDEFIGIQRVSGTLSCIVTRRTDSGVLIDVMPVSYIAQDWLPMLLQAFVCYLIISLLLLIDTAVFRNTDITTLVSESENVDSENSGRNDYGLLLRKLLGRILTAAAAVFPLFFAINSLFSDYSVLSFLLSDKWEKSLNIFAVTMVLLLIIMAVFACAIVKWVGKTISRNLDTNTGTAVSLFSSILRVVIIVWVFVTALYQVGVDMSTIIAGIGITTLALSLAAKDTVNDLIAGIFLVLDGNIHVGDWLEVNGFYGQVIDMNVRTTKIKFINKVVSVSNSAMTNVVNCSRDDSCVWFEFTVAFDTDIEALTRLIANNTDYFMKATAGMLLSAPEIAGVENTDINGITCVFGAAVDEANRKTATRASRTALVKLLQANGISLARRYYLDQKDLED